MAARELAGDEKLPVLRAYLAKWRVETGVFFGGIKTDATGDQWRQEAAKHPVFLLETSVATK